MSCSLIKIQGPRSRVRPTGSSGRPTLGGGSGLCGQGSDRRCWIWTSDTFNQGLWMPGMNLDFAYGSMWEQETLRVEIIQGVQDLPLHHESKCPKRHSGLWRRHGLTIFKNKKLLTSHLTKLQEYCWKVMVMMMMNLLPPFWRVC